ncbi:hypothetical protein ACFL3T_00250 [Patescibacteria group bacterium]
MKHKHTLKLRFVAALSIMVFLSGVWMSGTMAATSNPYEKEGLKYEEVKELYHKRVNDLFNSKLKLLKQGEKGSGTAEIPKGDNCSENNYSTFCLALASAKEYENYVVGLEKQKLIVDIPDNDLSIEKISVGVISKRGEIDNEIKRSKKTLDVALATYNELSGVYRQHLEYETLIKNLTKYNKKVTEFRKEVEKLPSKFVDATTTQCT